MKILIGCERSGIVREAFAELGHDESKKTCLWLKNLPKLLPTDIIKKDRYSNQTASGQNNLSPSKDRPYLRSKTYKGIAQAMAQQWGYY